MIRIEIFYLRCVTISFGGNFLCVLSFSICPYLILSSFLSFFRIVHAWCLCRTFGERLSVCLVLKFLLTTTTTTSSAKHCICLSLLHSELAVSFLRLSVLLSIDHLLTHILYKTNSWFFFFRLKRFNPIDNVNDDLSRISFNRFKHPQPNKRT